MERLVRESFIRDCGSCSEVLEDLLNENLDMPMIVPVSYKSTISLSAVVLHSL